MTKLISDKEIKFYKYSNLLILVTIMILGIGIAVYLYNIESNSLYFYEDSRGHAFQARGYVDSNQPGFFEHLYAAPWLPLPHLLLLPFTLIDPLFRSGFAGMFVSLPSHAVTSLILCKIIKRHVDNHYIPVVGAFLYAFNPNFLYLSLTTMTEAPFMLFFVTSAYYFQKWMFDSPENFIKSAIFVSLATLCRYESWILSISLVIMVIVTFIIRNKSGYYRRKRIIILTIIIFSIISLSGMILWVAWNQYRYGNPLEFFNSGASAAAHAVQGGIRVYLYLQPLNVLNVYGVTLLFIFGPGILIFALIYLSKTFLSKDENKSKLLLLYLFLVMPSIFTIVSMISGVGEMKLSGWYNSRFLILLGPLLILLTCMFLAYSWNKLKTLVKRNHNIVIILTVSIVAASFLYQSISPFFIVPIFEDALNDFSRAYSASAETVGKILSSKYDGKSTIFTVITGNSKSYIIVESGLPLKTYRAIKDSDSNSTSFQKPWLYANYLVLSKIPQGDIEHTVNYWMKRQDILAEYYCKAYEDKYYLLFFVKHSKANGCLLM